MTMADQLLDAIGDVGMDLIDTAEKVRFPKSLLRRTLPVAACMALLLGAGWYAQRWLASDVTQPDQTVHQPAVLADGVVTEPKISQVESKLVSAPYYMLELPGETRRVAAVDAAGNVLAEAENMELITDQATGEPLAFLATTEYGVDSDWASAERIVYDLQGQEKMRLCARRIEVVGNVAAIEFSTQNRGLYLLNGTALRDAVDYFFVGPDCVQCIYTDADGQQFTEFYGPDGSLLQQISGSVIRYASLPDIDRTLLVWEKDGLFGLMDPWGNWVVEPRFRQFSDTHNGYVRCKDWQNWFLVDLQTGEISYEIGKREASVIAYTTCLRWCVGTEFFVKDWNGNTLVPEADMIWVLDDEDDLTPERFLVKELGGDYVVRGADGAEQLRIVGAGTVEPVSSRTAAYTKTMQDPQTGEWVVDFALIDLETGVGNRNFEKAYIWGGTIDWKYGLFYVTYEDEHGVSRHDLMNEHGTVLLENLQFSSYSGETYLGGDVFLTETGYRRVDGSWLYRFE